MHARTRRGVALPHLDDARVRHPRHDRALPRGPQQLAPPPGGVHGGRCRGRGRACGEAQHVRRCGRGSGGGSHVALLLLLGRFHVGGFKHLVGLGGMQGATTTTTTESSSSLHEA